MDPIVADANRRFEFSKSLLHRAKNASDPEHQKSFAEMSVATAFSCLEGMLTHVFDHFTKRDDFDIFEQSIMQEKSVRLLHGKPSLGEQRFQSIEDRVQFLFWRFTGQEFDKNKTWWPDFANAVSVRNSIMHPKKKGEITAQDAERAILAIIATLDDLMLTVFKKNGQKPGEGLRQVIRYRW
jgi:hypothetical protein